jgi:hypothetical protein
MCALLAAPAVVVRSSLAPFDCVNNGGVRTMDAEPSIVCGVPGGPNARMRAVAALTIVLYVSTSNNSDLALRLAAAIVRVAVAAVCSRWYIFASCLWQLYRGRAGCARRYVLGLPAAFGLFLWRHRVHVRSDQLLRERGEGDSALTNAHIQVRAVARATSEQR